MEPEHRVLLLNATYEPLAVLSGRRALKLLFNNKAHVVEQSNKVFSTVRARLKLPSVIQTEYFVRRPYKKPKFSKKAVFIRDNFTCQYCGKTINKPTLDHILPRCRGGVNSWTNVITACHTCNNKKSNKIPKEAGMKLLSSPCEPRYLIYTELSTPGNLEKWRKYFDAYSNTAPVHNDGIFASAEA